MRSEIGRGLQSASVERGGDSVVELPRDACVRGLGGVREVMPALNGSLVAAARRPCSARRCGGDISVYAAEASSG